MSVFFEIGRTCGQSGMEKQAIGGSFFKFFNGKPLQMGLKALGLGAAGAAANELSAAHGGWHFGGSADKPLWHPSSHNLSIDPHTQGWGSAAWQAATRPLQTYRSMVGTNPKMSLQNMMSGGIRNQQLKFNPDTGNIEVVGGHYGLHPLFQQQLERMKSQNEMYGGIDPGFRKFLGLAEPPGAKQPAKPLAGPQEQIPKPPPVPAVVRNSFGPLHMNDYNKVPNVPMTSVF